MMQKTLLAISGIFTLFSACHNDKPGILYPKEVEILDPVALPKSNSMQLLAHYMPWFEDKTTNGNNQWGIHWTMANQNPDLTDDTGKREIASHYYPLIGPYASSDKALIEYHLLLMKYSGIDGVLIDWYGTYDLNDYAKNKRNTEALLDLLGKVGLKFAIVYEDQTTEKVKEAGLATSATEAAKTDMQYLQRKYFSQNTYLTQNGKPLLLTFGPRTLLTEADWSAAFSVLSPKPEFLTLWDHQSLAGSHASGEFAWVYQSNASLDNFYQNRMPHLASAMGSAYPGFKDFYGVGGWGSSMTWNIEPNHGATLRTTLEKAKQAGVQSLQLVTWNDFGEGTMLEPTLEFGYTSLETIADFAGTETGTSLFELIAEMYRLRKVHAGKTEVQKQLDQAFYYLVALRPDEAETAIRALSQLNPQP